MLRRAIATGSIIVTGLLATGCGGSRSALPTGDERVSLDPSEFTTDIDNPYWPMSPGTQWVYREVGADGTEQRIVVTVTDETRTVMGIESRVVHDVASSDGEIVENTYDWYAQDSDGNLWYFGEDTKEYDGTTVSIAGSWEAGVDGAQPGIAVPADPAVGLTYRQEYSAGVAEDAASVLSLDERTQTPAGAYQHALMTKDYTRLEPDVLEYKFYARGVGPVVTLGVSGEIGREELIRRTTG